MRGVNQVRCHWVSISSLTHGWNQNRHFQRRSESSPFLSSYSCLRWNISPHLSSAKVFLMNKSHYHLHLNEEMEQIIKDHLILFWWNCELSSCVYISQLLMQISLHLPLDNNSLNVCSLTNHCSSFCSYWRDIGRKF